MDGADDLIAITEGIGGGGGAASGGGLVEPAINVLINRFCPSDLDSDGEVGVTDFLLLLEAWGACPPEGACPGDVDGDGTVGVVDFIELLAAWGSCFSGQM